MRPLPIVATEVRSSTQFGVKLERKEMVQLVRTSARANADAENWIAPRLDTEKCQKGYLERKVYGILPIPSNDQYSFTCFNSLL